MPHVHPLTYDRADPLLERLRAAMADLPQVHEEETWGTLTFRVGRKLFGVLTSEIDRPRVLVFKPVAAEREALEADQRFFLPRYFRPWLGLVFDESADWDEIRELLTDSYCQVAPRALAAQVESPDAELGST